jgi:hypothetical protein
MAGCQRRGDRPSLEEYSGAMAARLSRMYAEGETAEHAEHAKTLTAMDPRAIPLLSPTRGEAQVYGPNRLRPRLVWLFLSRGSRGSRFD